MVEESKNTESGLSLAEIWTDEKLTALAIEARKNMQIIDRKYRFKTYSACFVGKDLAIWLKQKQVRNNS